MNIGFTGTQRGMSPEQLAAVRELIVALNDVQSAHHGDCIGADAEFHDICSDLGIPFEIHPPSKPDKRAFCQGARTVHEARPYLDRNHDIVDAADLLIAAPSGLEKRRSGTWATVRYARKRGIKIHIALPGGDVMTE